jgi:hypothetical protein
MCDIIKTCKNGVDDVTNTKMSLILANLSTEPINYIHTVKNVITKDADNIEITRIIEKRQSCGAKLGE